MPQRTACVRVPATHRNTTANQCNFLLASRALLVSYCLISAGPPGGSPPFAGTARRRCMLSTWH
eukprot:2050308-Prymnesium_polylepis.4